MITHTVDFCEKEPRFMLKTIFHFNLIQLLMMKVMTKQFYFACEKLEHTEDQRVQSSESSAKSLICESKVSEQIFTSSI